MSLLDRVPGELAIYIGGLFTVRRKQVLQDAGITHILTVLRRPLEDDLFKDFKHLVIEVDDVDDDNLIEHFPACNRFIQDALDGGGGVLVHCAMGKSRSATVTTAYLMSHLHLSRDSAIALIREARPFCDPNDGFRHQLGLYAQTGCTDDIEAAPAYQGWLYKREVDASRACGLAPDAEKIRFGDEHAAALSGGEGAESSGEFELRCRKCRRTLAHSRFLTPHTPAPNSHPSPTTPLSTHPSTPTPTTCAHHFLDPLSWMRPALEQGLLEGRLECPKCSTNVGKYAWQGMRCSCGCWVVPGISLVKGRVDEVGVGGKGGVGMGIRVPPGGGKM